MNKFVKLSAVLALATAFSALVFAAPQTFVVDGSPFLASHTAILVYPNS